MTLKTVWSRIPPSASAPSLCFCHHILAVYLYTSHFLPSAEFSAILESLGPTVFGTRSAFPQIASNAFVAAATAAAALASNKFRHSQNRAQRFGLEQWRSQSLHTLPMSFLSAADRRDITFGHRAGRGRRLRHGATHTTWSIQSWQGNGYLERNHRRFGWSTGT